MIQETIGLYRDVGLSIYINCSCPQMKKIRKCLQKVFKSNGLDVIIKCNIIWMSLLISTTALTDSAKN